jgi:hypothetical protein
MDVLNNNARSLSKLSLFFIIFALFFHGDISFCAGVDITQDIRTLPNKPTGFGELQWKNSSSKLNNGNKIAILSKNGVEAYEIAGENAILGEIEIAKMQYFFKDDMLGQVDMIFEGGKNNSKKLLNYAKIEFGEPQFIAKDYLRFVWFDSDVQVYIDISSEKSPMMRFSLNSLMEFDNNPYFELRPIPNMPGQFWGIKLGDPPDRLGGNVIKRITPDTPDKLYGRDETDNSFDGLPIDRTDYIFHKEKLVLVRLNFPISVTDEQLIQYACKKHGPPFYISSDNKEFSWYDCLYGITLNLKKKQSNMNQIIFSIE